MLFGIPRWNLETCASDFSRSGDRYLKLYGRPQHIVTAGRDRSQHRPDRELNPRVMFTILKVFHAGSASGRRYEGESFAELDKKY